MSLTRNDVEKVARLARLSLDDAEVDKLTEQLGAIVGYVEQLNEVDTTTVEPLSHPIDSANVFREDLTLPSFDRSAMLVNAPRTDGEYYLVPPVLGE